MELCVEDGDFFELEVVIGDFLLIFDAACLETMVDDELVDLDVEDSEDFGNKFEDLDKVDALADLVEDERVDFGAAGVFFLADFFF